MARLTRQERIALLLLAAALCAGTLVRWWNAHRTAYPARERPENIP